MYEETVSDALKDSENTKKEEEPVKEPGKKIKKSNKVCRRKFDHRQATARRKIIVKKKKNKDKHRREEIEPKTMQQEITRQNLREP
jgi:hypothetical protein